MGPLSSLLWVSVSHRFLGSLKPMNRGYMPNLEGKQPLKRRYSPSFRGFAGAPQTIASPQLLLKAEPSWLDRWMVITEHRPHFHRFGGRLNTPTVSTARSSAPQQGSSESLPRYYPRMYWENAFYSNNLHPSMM